MNCGSTKCGAIPRYYGQNTFFLKHLDIRVMQKVLFVNEKEEKEKESKRKIVYHLWEGWNW